MMIKKENNFEKTKNLLEKLILGIIGEYKWINGKYAAIYFKEVNNDLKILEIGMKECKFERDRDEIFQYCAEKYSEKYCPSTYYKYFSNENKLKYLDLRIEIDKILSRKNQFLSDFSTIQTEIIYN